MKNFLFCAQNILNYWVNWKKNLKIIVIFLIHNFYPEQPFWLLAFGAKKFSNAFQHYLLSRNIKLY